MVSINAASGKALAMARLELPSGLGISVVLKPNGNFTIDFTHRNADGSWTVLDGEEGNIKTRYPKAKR